MIATACSAALAFAATLALSACVAASYVSRDGMLWHPRHPLAVPDLAASGWRRVEVEGADLAFQKDRSGVIAVRVRCSGRRRPLPWESRELWLGIPRSMVRRRSMEVAGRPAVETIAQSGGLQIRTVVVKSEGCAVDLAHVVPPDSISDSGSVFDEFLVRTRLSGAP